jgi:hypothetical protein
VKVLHSRKKKIRIVWLKRIKHSLTLKFNAKIFHHKAVQMDGFFLLSNVNFAFMNLIKFQALNCRCIILSVIVIFSLNLQLVHAQPLSFEWQPGAASGKDCKCRIKINITNGTDVKNSVYSETQLLTISPHRPLRLNVGKGKPVFGNIDSVIWAEGVFYLDITPDTIMEGCSQLKYNGIIRIPTEIKSTNQEGFIEEKSLNPPGHVHIPTSQNKRPKKVSVDLSTSYVNLGYPANTYPIYRHYEWFDTDGDGKGNAFTLTYSDNTTHAFKENTNELGEVRLYEQGAFQQLVIATSETAVDILITKPVPVDSFSNTFAIKGPWTMTYYIEW